MKPILGEALQVVRSGAVPPPTPGTIQFYFSQRTLQMMDEYPWPGNLREYAMTIENALTFCLAELAEVGGVERPDVIQVRPRLIHDLLLNPVVSEKEQEDGDSIAIAIEAQQELKQVSSHVERQYFKALYLRPRGDFRVMAQELQTLGRMDAESKLKSSWAPHSAVTLATFFSRKIAQFRMPTSRNLVTERSADSP